uniref:OTU domain-containing protein n=1 Tax=Elaeophora elaphi TaxID=1147741 RepID=A0A0R3RXW3_9BILA
MSRLIGKLEVGKHQAELILRKKPISLSKECEYSKLIASQVEMKPKDVTKMKYFRLKLLPEQYCCAEYYYSENEPYHVYFHKVSNRWFVYKSYQRISDLYATDSFNTKVYYMGVIPDDIMNRGDFYEINDFISTVLILHGEYNRKLELQYVTGGGFRPNLRSMKCRKVLPTFLASYAREQKCGPSMIKVLIDRHIADIRAYQQTRIQNIEKNLEQNSIDKQIKACFFTMFCELLICILLQKPEIAFRHHNVEVVINFVQAIVYCQLEEVKAFISNHKHWVHARKQMSNYAALQHKVRKTVPFKRSSAARLIALQGVTVSDLCNELIDYPIWVGFHYYFMRVLNKNGLRIVYDDINYAVQEDGKLRHLRILPSKYAYKPQATTVFGETKVYCKGRIPLDHWPLSDYPPSIESVSGYSTITKMSTATTSPNSWQNDWKMQPRHDEYDHRLTETTIPDMRDTRARGDEQFAIRFNKELNKRIDFALADIETVLSTTMLNFKMDPCVIAACDSDVFPAILDRHGDMTWLKNAESYISSVLMKDNPTDEEKKDLKVLHYAKQRYEQTLSKYDSRPLTEATDNAQITDRDAWPLDSDFSNLALVDRADRISLPRVIEFFHRYHLKGNGMKVLAIGTLVFVIMLLMLFALILIVVQNNEDLGYCPSNVMGFDPENPHQVKWMQDLLNMKTPVRYDNFSVSAAHFFMLDD